MTLESPEYKMKKFNLMNCQQNGKTHQQLRNSQSNSKHDQASVRNLINLQFEHSHNLILILENQIILSIWADHLVK